MHRPLWGEAHRYLHNIPHCKRQQCMCTLNAKHMLKSASVVCLTTAHASQTDVRRIAGSMPLNYRFDNRRRSKPGETGSDFTVSLDEVVSDAHNTRTHTANAGTHTDAVKQTKLKTRPIPYSKCSASSVRFEVSVLLFIGKKWS
ncbi:hypothetical protein ZHAS_00018004 [Anopheles sinensis]|uniref:Uncharacterized protein n=1 Tax=Anopheles sinensis TaxID=74873 RepID=A0A084WHI9_ANOSI|nr:hypothetical protein ZHAS_00018004 [Anopheles sinensis]